MKNVYRIASVAGIGLLALTACSTEPSDEEIARSFLECEDGESTSDCEARYEAEVTAEMDEALEDYDEELAELDEWEADDYEDYPEVSDELEEMMFVADDAFLDWMEAEPGTPAEQEADEALIAAMEDIADYYDGFAGYTETPEELEWLFLEEYYQDRGWSILDYFQD